MGEPKQSGTDTAKRIFILPAGTVCKRGDLPFTLAKDTEILTNPVWFEHIRRGFIEECSVDGQRFCKSQEEPLSEKPVQAPEPLSFTTNNSSFESK